MRHLALRFGELFGREVEHVSITRDTNESDLKQRREIRDGRVEYVDQPPVRAALHGRVLVLEGIERAERNVLPLLNNLLENREMQLEDRRFLLAPRRAEALRAERERSGGGGDESSAQLVPVHPDFLVVALGAPRRGNPLDPPLRSRFSAFVVPPAGGADMLAALVARSRVPFEVPPAEAKRLCDAADALQARAGRQAEEHATTSGAPPVAPPEGGVFSEQGELRQRQLKFGPRPPPGVQARQFSEPRPAAATMGGPRGPEHPEPRSSRPELRNRYELP